MLMGQPYLSIAARYPDISVTDDDLKKIVSISTADGNRGIILTVKGVGKMTMERAMFLDEPPRMIYDLTYDGPSFASVTGSVNSPYLKNIRVGYHPNKIRLVLDANGPDIPKFSHLSRKQELTIVLESRSQGKTNSAGSGAKVMNIKETNPPVSEENNDSHKTESIPADSVKAASSVIMDASIMDTSGPKEVFQQEPSLLPEKMMQLEPGDGSEERTLFLKGIEAFKYQRWPESGKNLKHLIKTYPKGQYSEKAYFLLAKSMEQLHSQTPSEHFSVIKSHYDDAIFRFPASIFVPDALLSVGNLCMKLKNHDEALGYYNLVIEKKTRRYYPCESNDSKG
jgi:TolA-binding protein